jgi:hypothetical protein
MPPQIQRPLLKYSKIDSLTPRSLDLTARPSMSRLPKPLHCSTEPVLSGVDGLAMTRNVRNRDIRRGTDSLAPAPSAVRLSHLYVARLPPAPFTLRRNAIEIATHYE